MVINAINVRPSVNDFKFDALKLGLDKSNCTFFWSKEQKFGDWFAKDTGYFKFDIFRLNDMTGLPTGTERYFAQQISIGINPLRYFRTPHVLFKGRIDIDSSIEVVDGS